MVQDNVSQVEGANVLFPWFSVLSLCMGMVAHSIVFTAVLPFVAFMVVDFHMADNVNEAGYFAGFSSSKYSLFS